MLREERKLVNAPDCYPILDLSFKGKRWGAKGVSFRRQEVRTLWDGLRRGVSGLLALAAPRAPPARARPPAPCAQLPRGGRWKTPARPETSSTIPAPGWRELQAPRFPTLHGGFWGRGTVWAPGLGSWVPVGPDSARGPGGPGALGSGALGEEHPELRPRPVRIPGPRRRRRHPACSTRSRKTMNLP